MLKRAIDKLFGRSRRPQELAALEDKDISVHPRTRIGRFTTVGHGTNINGPAFIASRADAPVTIGRYCAIAHNLRILKKRFTDEIIAQLSRIDWWNWPEEKVRRNRRFFKTDFSANGNLDLESLIVD